MKMAYKNNKKEIKFIYFLTHISSFFIYNFTSLSPILLVRLKEETFGYSVLDSDLQNILL